MNSTDSTSRLFIGAEIPTFLKEPIAGLRTSSSFPSARWTKEENLHVTLLFIGNVREEILMNVMALFREGYRTCHPIILSSARYVLAPKPEAPRMIWMRFGRSESFSTIVKHSQDWIQQIQPLPQQRRNPVPHITVARLDPSLASDLYLPAPPAVPSWTIKKLTLWKSEMTVHGAMYTPLETFSLHHRR